MDYTLKIQPRYCEYILNGTKRIELRLFDKKRRQINVGETILLLKEPELEEKIYVKVTGLLIYESFNALFKDFDINILADKSMTKEDLLKDLEIFYTPEMQKKYGVIGIRIEKT